MTDENDETGPVQAAASSESDEEQRRAGERNAPATHVRHSSSATDLETGRPLDSRDDLVALVRADSEIQAMGSGARRRSQFKRAISPMRNKFRWNRDDSFHSKKKKEGRKWRNGMAADDDFMTTSIHGRLMVQASAMEPCDVEEGKVKVTQYRLNAKQPRKGIVARFLGMLGCSVGSDGLYDDATGGDSNGLKCCGFSPNYWVTKYLNWTFRSSIILVLFSGALGFFGLTLLFAGLLLAAGRNHPECIHVNGEEFGNSTVQFGDAYALSWTTFSTVGYGLIFPSTSAVVPQGTYCNGVQILCTWEAFVGVLFASFCGAVVFGKVSRIRSQAQVVFSDPVVVRYGMGVDEEVDEADPSSENDDDEKLELRQLPCPVLEFRVVNLLHSTKGGELMDCTMNVVACIKESQACPTLRRATMARRRKGKKRRARRAISSRRLSHPAIPEKSSFHEGHPEDSGGSISGRTGHLAQPSRVNRMHQSFDEDPTGKLVSKMILSKLELDTQDHPFFKRVWHARHTLDAQSPLLSSEARRKLKENHGFWPEDLNTHDAVRESIHFDQILVSLSATNNADASSVYAQKVYHWEDVCIGYRFANVLYRDLRDRCLHVDTTMINDVLEQYSGGAEPLTCSHERRFSDLTFM